MRSLWQGTVSVGLVALPVDIYAATEDHGPGLHLVHAVDGGRVRHRRVCELDGREVRPEETARGWEAPDAAPWSSKTPISKPCRCPRSV
ncbi:Ku protein [Streptomyces platensis]|uniref:Ku protein n=1 Tax=Streptomyces platensis TaxID=58346 RepID=UPI00386A18D0|nr:hypothetical protein OG962_37045 [Streptomyces platensis]